MKKIIFLSLTAVLIGVSITCAAYNPEDEQRFKVTGNCYNGDLSYIILSGKTIRSVKGYSDIIDTNLMYSYLNNTNLDRVVFYDSNLRDIKTLENASCSDTDFTNAKLNYTKFIGNNLNGTMFMNAKLQNSKFKNTLFNKTIFYDAKLQDAEFANVTDNNNSGRGTGSDFTKAVLINATIKDTAFNGTIFYGTNLSNAVISSTKFNNVTFTDTNFSDITIDNGDGAITSFDGCKFDTGNTASPVIKVRGAITIDGTVYYGISASEKLQQLIDKRI